MPAEDIVAAARRFGAHAAGDGAVVDGRNQSTVGTLKNRALINLCLATGNIGRPGTGPLSLTGQPNAMGGRESGRARAPAARLPAGRPAPRTAPRCAGFWDTPRASRPSPGIAATELVEALEERRVKVLWIVATNPVVSQPDAGRFAAALRRAELVICQDAYHPTETGALAHVRAARRAVAREGRDDDELRAARRPRAARARPARRGAARLGDLRPRGPRARPPRGVRVAYRRPQVHAEYVRTTDGPAVRPDRPLARAAAPRGAAAVAVPAPPDGTPARSGSTPRGASRRRTAARGWRRRRTPSPPTRPTPTSRSS